MSLREPLDDLLAELPSYVVPDTGAAWAAGSRRRTRRRVAGAAVVVIVAMLATLSVGVLPRSRDVAPAGTDQTVSGYPSHVEDSWFRHDLPSRPGPLAAVLKTGGFTWLAVGPGGRAWTLPQTDPIDDFVPALSADGRMLGYLSGHTTYVVRDLATGEETRFDEITDNAGVRSDEGTWWVSPQAPGFWSPDGTRVLVRAGAWDESSRTAELVLGADGSVIELDGRRGYPAGWLDDDTVGWLEVHGTGADRALALVGTDLDGRVVRRTPLDPPAGRPEHLSQWSATLSPAGDRMAVVLGNRTGTLTTVSTGDGSVVRSENVGAEDWCSTSWRDGRPLFWQSDGDAASLDTTTGERVIVTDPGLGATCVMAAADALAGEPHRALGERLFGDGWLSWHWRDASLAGLAALALAVLAGWFVRRRRRARLSG
jgi:hypothetical protein